MKLSAALIDVRGTLWPERFVTPTHRLDAERLHRLCATGIPEATARRLWANLAERIAGVDGLPYFDLDLAIREAAASVGVGNVPTGVIRAAACVPAARHCAPLPGVHELLAAARGYGLRRVVVSNAVLRDGRAYWEDFRAHGIAGFISAVVSSVDTRWRKPHPRIYLAALAAARASPEHCVMIGDSEENDVRPAASLGLRTIRVGGDAGASTTADAFCRSLDDVAEVLHGWVG